MLGDSSQWVPHGSACLAKGHCLSLFLCVCETFLEDKGCLPLQQRADLLTAWNKEMVSPLEQRVDILTAHY